MLPVRNHYAWTMCVTHYTNDNHTDLSFVSGMCILVNNITQPVDYKLFLSFFLKAHDFDVPITLCSKRYAPNYVRL